LDNQIQLTEPLETDSKIWRYMDLSKFLSLLENNSLFFTRSDKFQDPYEGTLNQPQLLAIKNEINNLKVLIADKSTNKNVTGGDEKKSLLASFFEPFLDALSHLSLNVLEASTDINKKLRSLACINCWHLNDAESNAMWKLYLKSNEGIAIQSTVKRLRDSFISNNSTVHISKVRYLNYELESFGDDIFLSPFIHKRKSFEHEKELRAIVFSAQNSDINKDWKLLLQLFAEHFKDRLQTEECEQIVNVIPNDFGINIPVDLDMLVENIYIAPTAPKWFVELINQITSRYNINKKVIQSSLYETPSYVILDEVFK
jgi:hypothetical protein